MTVVKTPWLDRTMSGLSWEDVETDIITLCDDFWPKFDWNKPKRGEQMRLVFSTDPVRGAQKSRFIRNDSEWLIDLVHFDFGRREDLNFLCPMDRFFDEFLDYAGEHIETTLWWWPEYREPEA